MKRMNQQFLVFVLFAASLSTSAAHACRFQFQEITLQEAKSEASTVFWGEVSSLKKESVTFKVLKSWKGINSPEIKVAFNSERKNSCDSVPHWAIGEKYIVFTSGKNFWGNPKMPEFIPDPLNQWNLMIDSTNADEKKRAQLAISQLGVPELEYVK